MPRPADITRKISGKAINQNDCHANANQKPARLLISKYILL
jgi:hypothetical protein